MAGHLSVAAVKALVFAFFAVALFAASSTAQDFDAAAAPAPAPALDHGAAAHSAMASGAMIICLPLFLSVLALFKH